MIQPFDDTYFMKRALQEAEIAFDKGEVPVGAVIVGPDGRALASTGNRIEELNDPTAHAEIQLIRAAGAKLKNYRLNDSILYVTLEPCAMCFGSMMHARVKRLVFGAFDFKSGVCGSCINLINENCTYYYWFK